MKPEVPEVHRTRTLTPLQLWAQLHTSSNHTVTKGWDLVMAEAVSSQSQILAKTNIKIKFLLVSVQSRILPGETNQLLAKDALRKTA